MGSSLDHRWVPKSTPQRDRLYRFFTKSVGALHAGLLVLFQGRDVRGGRPLVPTEEWDTARPPPTPNFEGTPPPMGLGGWRAVSHSSVGTKGRPQRTSLS